MSWWEIYKEGTAAANALVSQFIKHPSSIKEAAEIAYAVYHNRPDSNKRQRMGDKMNYTNSTYQGNFRGTNQVTPARLTYDGAPQAEPTISTTRVSLRPNRLKGQRDYLIGGKESVVRVIRKRGKRKSDDRVDEWRAIKRMMCPKYIIHTWKKGETISSTSGIQYVSDSGFTANDEGMIGTLLTKDWILDLWRKYVRDIQPALSNAAGNNALTSTGTSPFPVEASDKSGAVWGNMLTIDHCVRNYTFLNTGTSIAKFTIYEFLYRPLTYIGESIFHGGSNR